MNKDTGEFRKLGQDAKARPGEIEFAIGEIVKVKGAEFRVRKITKRDLILRPIRRVRR